MRHVNKTMPKKVASLASADRLLASAPGLGTDADAAGTGQIVGILGGVVDVLFTGAAPRINDLLYAGSMALEVISLLDNGAVRCMALAPVRGLGLATPVRATGAPIQVPVGDAVLGRMLNVFGEPMDGKPAPATAAPTIAPLTSMGNLNLATISAAAPSKQAISTYIISLVMARSIE